MDREAVEGAELRREEEEVEFILGALPSLWHNTQNVLRDLGYQRTPEVEAAEQQEGLIHRGTEAIKDKASTSARNEDEAEEKVCRMCFSSEHELGDDGMSIGKLIAPCHCDGSMRYVHDTCLDQWRRKSAATEAARVCGQCHARYRFRRSRYSNLMAFVQASQMIRVLVCFLLVFFTSIVLGAVGLISIRTVAKLEGTPLSFVRNAALRQVQIEKYHWNITLNEDEARATVWVPSNAWQHNGAASAPRIDQDFYLRADLEVFASIRQQQMHNPTYWRRVKRDGPSFRPTSPRPGSCDPSSEQERMLQRS